MVRKTTVNLPEDLKAAVEVEARRRGITQAALIRQAIATAMGRPNPRPGIIDGQPFAERTDEFLAGFGDR